MGQEGDRQMKKTAKLFNNRLAHSLSTRWIYSQAFLNLNRKIPMPL